jgi:hypothetical protein
VTHAIPLTTHLFLIVAPALIAVATLLHFLRGRRRGR